jgi:hypothetical protein
MPVFEWPEWGDDPAQRYAAFREKLDQLEEVLDEMHSTITVLTRAAVRKPGRPLTPRHERSAREYAAYDVEHSTQRMAVLAARWREQSRVEAERHQYTAAGWARRIAEIMEARFHL